MNNLNLITLASLPTWELLVIIIFSMIGLYVIAILVIYFLMKRVQKKAFSELDSLIVYEKERMQFVNDLVAVLEASNYHLKDNIKVVVDEQNDLLSSKRVDMSKAKQQTDFLLIYFQKLLKEKGIRKKEPFAKYYEDINKYLFIDSESDNYPYKKYNNLAAKYNSFLSLGLFSILTHGKNNPQAPTL